jgi:flagellar hook-associated protein 1 FlgK
MGGLTTSLLIGSQALEAAQGALNATSNNIANANTPGYTREVPSFTEGAENLVGGETIGGGVQLSSLQSIRDELLNNQIAQQTSAQSSVDAQSSSLQNIQTFFTTSGDDIGSALSTFSSSLAQLSSSSSSGSSQQSVLSAGQGLAQAFNATSNGLTSAQTAADGQVTQTVAQINQLTQQIAQLNGQVGQLTAQGQDGGPIEDQRDQLVQQLSQLTGISVSQGSNGEDTITTGNGSPLVVGPQSFALQTTTGTNGFQQVLDSSGTNITAQIQGGTLGGAIQTRDTTIPGFLSTLNSLATQLATAFNAAQTGGFDSTGAAGQAFFSVPTTGGAAAGISVALTSPSQIAVSSTASGASGSNGNVANLSAALTTAPTAGGSSVENGYSSLVFQVGNAASNATAQSSAIGDTLQQLTNQQGSVSGVSIDEETTNMIKFQTAYEAAARIVSTIQQLDTDTLDMGSSTSF